MKECKIIVMGFGSVGQGVVNAVSLKKGSVQSMLSAARITASGIMPRAVYVSLKSLGINTLLKFISQKMFFTMKKRYHQLL